MTEWLHFHFSLSCIGEGNGNPLQCSCLENPRDGEPGGLQSLGFHRVGHDWGDLAAAAAAVFHFIYAPHHLIYSSVNEYLCCIHVLTIVSSAEMNVGVYVSLQTMVFSGYMPKSGIAIWYCCSSVAKSCLTLRPHELQHARLPCPSLSPQVYSDSSLLSLVAVPIHIPTKNVRRIIFSAHPLQHLMFETVIEKLSTNKIPGLDDFTGAFYQTFREALTPILLKLFKNLKRKIYSQTHSMRPLSCWYQNETKKVKGLVTQSCSIFVIP